MRQLNPDEADLWARVMATVKPLRGVVAAARDRHSGSGIGLGEVLPNGARVLQKDSWAAAVVDELSPLPQDIRVDKYRISGFWDTPLDSILKNLGIKTVLFAGVNTDQCVLHSLTDANFLEQVRITWF